MDNFGFNILFSSIASLVARTVTFPLDTLKTRQQHATVRKGLWFNGLGVTLCFSVPASAVYLSTYDQSKYILEKYGLEPGSFLLHGFAAVGAESISGILFTPMEVLKQKMQVKEQTVKSMDIIRQTAKNHGVGGFYRGYFLSQAVFVPYTVAYFISYERLKVAFDVKESCFWGYLVSSSLAAAFAGAISNPMDVVKTRVQIASNMDTRSVIRELYAKYGWKWITKGIVARIGWVAPSMTITITIFELLKDINNTNIN